VVGRVKPRRNFMKNSFQAPVVLRSAVIVTVKTPVFTASTEQARLPRLVTVVSPVAALAPY